MYTSDGFCLVPWAGYKRHLKLLFSFFRWNVNQTTWEQILSLFSVVTPPTVILLRYRSISLPQIPRLTNIIYPDMLCLPQFSQPSVLRRRHPSPLVSICRLPQDLLLPSQDLVRPDELELDLIHHRRPAAVDLLLLPASLRLLTNSLDGMLPCSTRRGVLYITPTEYNKSGVCQLHTRYPLWYDYIYIIVTNSDRHEYFELYSILYLKLTCFCMYQLLVFNCRGHLPYTWEFLTWIFLLNK
jgi:hypothetical protein